MSSFVNKLSLRERIITGLVVLMVVGFVYYTFEYEVQQKRIAELEIQKAEVDNQAMTFKSAASVVKQDFLTLDIQMAQQQVVQLQDEIALLKSRMSGNPVDVVRALRLTAKRSQADFQSVDTEERKVTKGRFQYKQINIRIGMVSSYQGIIDLMRSLDTIPAIMSIEDLALARDPKLLPKIQANMTVRLFVL